MIDSDRYNSPEAKAAREAAARMAEIAHEFGDPNLGHEYKDPFADYTFPTEITMHAGVNYSTRDGMQDSQQA